ncbi:MAG: hypothetical protein ACKORJ_04400 [Bacteroidota bacterium]
MKRNTLLTISLIALSMTAAGLFWYDSKRGETVDPSLFRLPAESAPDRILIKGPADSVVLSRSGSRWIVNDTYEADDRRMQLFFSAIDRARPRQAGTGPNADSVLSAMNASGIRITISEDGEILRRFTSLGDARKLLTWYRADGAELYRMIIPGYRAYLHELFDVRPNSWRARRLFNFNWRNFVSLTVDHSNAPADGFTVAQDKGMFKLTGIAATDTARLNSYLDAVSLAEATEVMTVSSAALDSMLSVRPSVIITATETSGRVHELRLTDGSVALLNGNDVVRLGRNTAGLLRSRRREFISSVGK